MCLQLVKNFPAFYGPRGLITAFITASHLSISEPDQFGPCPHATSWRFILILIFPHKPGSSKWSLSLKFLPQTLYEPLLSPNIFHLPHPSHTSSFDHRLWDSSLRSLIQSPVTKSLLGCNICLSILFSKTFSPFITAFTTPNLTLWLAILAVLDVTYRVSEFLGTKSLGWG